MATSTASPSAEDATFQKTLVVKIHEGTPKEASFEFTIPTLHDEIKIGTRIKALRKVLDPSWDGFDQGLDGGTQFNLRVCATFEQLLTASSAAWVFTTSSNGAPVVDSAKFPPAKVNDIYEAYQGFQQALSTFRDST